VIDTDSPTGEPADESPLAAGMELTIKGRTFWLLRAHRLRNGDLIGDAP
jgi:hypothetical protein